METGDSARTLLVLRHAKAEREPVARDAERPLSGRGERDAAAAGRWLLAEGLLPELVLCSSAKRTRQTWERVREAMGEAGAHAQAKVTGQLYAVGAEAVLALVRQAPDDCRTALLVGHNPALHQLAMDLTGDWGLAFPTAALAVIRLPARWQDAAHGSGELAAFWSPRAQA